MPAPRPAHLCSFCSRDVSEVELMFKSHVGGCPPSICADCVEWFGEIIAAHQASPDRAVSLIAVHNAVAKRFRDARG